MARFWLAPDATAHGTRKTPVQALVQLGPGVLASGRAQLPFETLPPLLHTRGRGSSSPHLGQGPALNCQPVVLFSSLWATQAFHPLGLKHSPALQCLASHASLPWVAESFSGWAACIHVFDGVGSDGKTSSRISSGSYDFCCMVVFAMTSVKGVVEIGKSRCRWWGRGQKSCRGKKWAGQRTKGQPDPPTLFSLL